MDFRYRLRIVSARPRQFAPLQVGSCFVSIQASSQHASRPEGENDVWATTHWEVALFDADANWITLKTHPDAFHEPWASRWVYSTTEGSATGQFVPTDAVHALLLHLNFLPNAPH